MKTTYFYLGAGLSLLLMAGCDNRWEEVQPTTPSEAAREIRLTASLDDSSTRLELTDENGKLKSTWEAGDSFQVFRADGSSTTFTLESGAGTSAATFVGTPEGEAYEEGEMLSAVFGDPNAYSLDNDKNLTLNISNQTGQLDSRYQLLYGESEFSADGTAFQFKHVVSLLKIVIPTTETLSQVTLTNSELFTQATLIINQKPSDASNLQGLVNRGDLLYSMEKEQNGTYPNSVREGINVTGTFASQNGEVTVYFYILPARFYYQDNEWLSTYHVKPVITALTEGGVKMYCTNSFNERLLEESGKMYRLNAILYTPTDFPNENTADGDSEPYELRTEDDLYSLMMRTRLDLVNKNGVRYQTCRYKLMNDIYLTNQMPWTPGGFYGEFDGNGQTIGGSITSTSTGSLLFEYVNDATVKDLTLAFSSITFTHTDQSDYFGVLCTFCGNGNLVHITNRTNVTPYAHRIGGLVGSLENYSTTTMIACGNEGNLTSGGEVEYMGGLVGYVRNDCTIEACYNTGNLTAPEAVCMGGLVGYDEDGQSTLNACWTSGSWDIIGTGSFTNCIHVATGATPSEEQIAEMNSAMQNGVWTFNSNGRPSKDNSSSVPNIPAEDW